MNNLRAAVRGTVLLPGDDWFDISRRPWNLAIEQDVLAVVEAADADDVASLVRFARRERLRIATQPGGHGASGTASGTILLRTARLDELSVDPERRVARVGAGVRAGQVTAAAAVHGLVAKPGSSPIVSVAGYTLGGGLGWFARKYGLSCDHVTAFEVVDAEGNRLRASDGENPDLFWALCGGGGDFAIVTALEMELHHEPDLFGGTVTWPDARAAEVFDAYRGVTADAPVELTVWVRRVKVPGGGPELVQMSVTFLGSEAEGRQLLKAFDAIGGDISDTRRMMSVPEIGTITNDPVDPGPSVSRTELLGRLDDAGVAALTAGPVDPLLAVQVRHLGGRLPQPSDKGPHGAISEEHEIYMVGMAPTARHAEAIAAGQAELTAALGAAVTGRKPFTFLNPSESPADAFEPEALALLREVKSVWDPEGVFVSNFPTTARPARSVGDSLPVEGQPSYAGNSFTPTS